MSFISDSFWKCRHLFAPRPLTLCLSVQMSRAQKEKIAMIMCNLPSQTSDVREAKQARVGLGFSDRRAARRGGSGKRPRDCGGDSISKVSTYRLTEVANRSVPGAPPCNCPIGPHQGLSSRVSAHRLHSYVLSVTQAPCGVDRQFLVELNPLPHSHLLHVPPSPPRFDPNSSQGPYYMLVLLEINPWWPGYPQFSL